LKGGGALSLVLGFSSTCPLSNPQSLLLLTDEVIA
jgi:hypothetical protein